jgi:hypothetical protein
MVERAHLQTDRGLNDIEEKYLLRRRFDLRPQNRMQTPPGHDVGLASEDARGGFLHVHKLVQPKRSFGMIEKQIDIGIVARLASCDEPNR